VNVIPSCAIDILNIELTIEKKILRENIKENGNIK
jgi:hypothetical protein